MKISDAMTLGRQLVPQRAHKSYLEWDSNNQVCLACDLGAVWVGGEGYIPTLFQIRNGLGDPGYNSIYDWGKQLQQIVTSPVAVPLDVMNTDLTVYNVVTWMNDYYPTEWPTSRVVEWLRSIDL